MVIIPLPNRYSRTTAYTANRGETKMKFVSEETKYYCKLRSSDSGKMIDVLISKSELSQRVALERGRQIRQAKAAERRFEKTLERIEHPKQDEEPKSVVKTEEQIAKRKAEIRKWLTGKKKDTFRLKIHDTFKPNDLFVTLTLNNNSIDNGEKLLEAFRQRMRDYFCDEFHEKFTHIGVKERGIRTGRLHFHLAVESGDTDKTRKIKQEIKRQWQERGYGEVHFSALQRKEGVIAAYLDKCFDEAEMYAHAYFEGGDIKRPQKPETAEIDKHVHDKLFAIARNEGETTLAKYIESVPQMKGWRLLSEPIVCDPFDRIDRTPFIKFTAFNVTEEIQRGELIEHRNIGEIEEWWAEKLTLLEGIDVKMQLGDWEDEVQTASFFRSAWGVDNYTSLRC